MRIVIYPYKMSSHSTQALATKLNGVGHQTLRVYPDRTYRPRSDDIIINWGCSNKPLWGDPTLNKCEAVNIASNKLSTLQKLRENEVQVPAFYTNPDSARHALSDGVKVFARSVLRGHSGEGIVVMTRPEDFVAAPLYTLEFKRTKEYRVHIFKGDVIDVQEKRKREGTGVRGDCDVWNHGNDYVYCRDGVAPHFNVLDISMRAVEALGLDFGAVDIGYNAQNNTCVVFEVNTAPGLTGTTLEKYAEAIHELV
jgi:hypothetical protein